MIDDKPNKRAWQLLWVLLMHPTYYLILADDSEYPGTNWTWTFDVNVRHDTKTIAFRGTCT